jgi:hypothetical protein
MRGSLLGLSALGGILAVTVAVVSAQSSSTPSPEPDRIELRARAFQKLQERTAQAIRDRVAKEAPGPRNPTVVCGMLVIPADATIDPGIKKPAPQDKKYTMKTLPPPCERER